MNFCNQKLTCDLLSNQLSLRNCKNAKLTPTKFKKPLRFLFMTSSNVSVCLCLNFLSFEFLLFMFSSQKLARPFEESNLFVYIYLFFIQPNPSKPNKLF